MKQIILIFFFLITTLANAQIAWEKPFGGPTRPILNSVIHTPDDFFYVCGKDTSNMISRGFLAKLDRYGNTIWEKHYTEQDSDYWFDNMLLLDSTTLIIQSASLSFANNFYSVPKIIKMDTAGIVIDSIWPDISDVYNGTGNGGLYAGANHTFWAFTYIGTIGISNEIQITRRNENLNPILTITNGAFYDQQFSFNKKGQMVYDVFIDEFDSILGVYNPDHINLRDTAGISVFSTIHDTLPSSNNILRTEDEGYTLFYKGNDTMTIRHFDSGGIQQRIKYYPTFPGQIYKTSFASDSGYFILTLDYDLQTNRSAYTVYKFNETDDTLWTQAFTHPYADSYRDLKPTADGGAIIIFRNQLYNDSINYLVRLGPNGERFPFTLQINPTVFCAGDTVSISTFQPAVSYLWSTGDTTAVLHVVTTGDYGLIVTDTSGTPFTIHPVSVVFDNITQVVLNDLHTCNSSVHLYAPLAGATTIWSDERFGYYVYPNRIYQTDTVPDSLQIWVLQQTPAGCRTSDTAMIYFDDCTEVIDLLAKDDLLLISTGNHSFIIKNSSGKIIEKAVLFDLTGKLVWTSSSPASLIEADVSFLNPGVYIFQCVVGTDIFRRKLLIR